MRTPSILTLGAVATLTLLPAAVQAQSLGSFTWQLQPFCNKVTVTVTQNGAIYTLDGYDDQCGAAQRAPLVGLATPNPDGTIQLGLHIVTATGGRQVSVDARITLPGASGTWSDSAGNAGVLALGGNATGSARPAPPASGAWGGLIEAPASNTEPGLVIRDTSPTLGAESLRVETGAPASVPLFQPVGIHSTSHSEVAIAGISDTNFGVVGGSVSATGVRGASTTGTGVSAFSSSGVALSVDGAIKVEGFRPPVFTHTATAANTAANGTRIDNPLTNGNPNAMLFITHAYVTSVAAVYWTHATSVYYNPAVARWEIYADDFTALPVGLRFNVMVVTR